LAESVCMAGASKLYPTALAPAAGSRTKSGLLAARILLSALGVLLAAQVASHVLDLGSADAWIADWSYRLTMAGAATAVATRAFIIREHRVAWTLIAVGLAAWTAGDFYYFLVLAGGPITYPSVTDVFYFAFYGCWIVGLRLLRGKAPGSVALMVVLLALATLWSWLVFGAVVDGAPGGTAAVATTVAYPLLDLVLVASAVLALSARGWRADRVFWILAAGFLTIAVGDSAYAAQVAQGTYVDGTLIEVLWPAGALCVAAAAWAHPTAGDDDRAGSVRVVEVLTLVGIVVGLAILFIDHFARVDTVTLGLAGATLLAVLLQRVVIHRDRAQAQRAADVAEALRRAALDCIVSFDAAGIVSEWNDAAAKTFGYSRDVALGAELAELVIPPAARARHRNGLERMGQSADDPQLNSQMEVMAMRADGSEFPIELMIAQTGVDPPQFTGFLRDISERRQREEENERLAALVRSSDNAIVSTDLHGIVTAWNDSAQRLYGYTEEQALGRTIAELISPPEDADDMRAITDSVFEGQIRTFETRQRRKDGTVLDVSLRAFAIRDLSGEIIGVCTSTHDVTERRRSEQRERSDREGRLWRDRIRTALDVGHFMFWGQPVVDATTGAVHHHELLLRMDLDGSVITPNQFLPHAENCDLITQIDRFAVTTGLDFATTTPVAINLSAKSLEDPRLLTHIRACLAQGSVAGNVIFEITETAAVANLDAACELVTELTRLGFGVALDDFGTGYGSFTYLGRLPVTELKIDIEFVRALAENPTDQRLIKSLVAVATNFGMKSVAEGVEDQGTQTLLRDLGVDYIQGYHIGYPTQMTLSSRWPAAAATIRYPPATKPQI
jgi:PAS domain S-box-containing protein